MISRHIVRGLVLVVSAVALTSCVKTVNIRGYIADEELVSEIVPGVDNQESVEAALGTPSIKATFDDRTWYYVSRKTKNLAFLQPRLVDQQIMAVHFDKDGNVEGIKRYTLADARKVSIVDRKTPTRGRQLGLLQQLFGNIGRFAGTSQGGPGAGAGNPGR